jgi:anti-sigma factor RsiW
MSHLGQRISALIDGELSDTERDRVLTHIAGCDECRQEAVALRALKHRMHSLGEAMVDAALTGRLMAMAMPPDGRPWTARPPWRARGAFPAARMLTAGILASTVAGLGAAAFFAGGEPQAPGPKVTPAVDTFLVQHAIVTGDLPVTPASGTAGGSAAAVPAAGPSRAAASASPSGPAAAAAVGSPARAEQRPAGHESRDAQPGRRQSASGQSASGQSASGQSASGMMRRSLPQALIGAGPPAPRALVTVTASPGP